MGKAKLVIDFENTHLPVRIHGTNDESSIGRPITRGCIRLKNKDILHLINLIQGKQVYVIIQP